MKKGNMIDLAAYRKQRFWLKEEESDSSPSMRLTGTCGNKHRDPDDLKTAIQHLIHRLRELGPIKPKFGK